jgi:hypothetical protein
MYRYEENSEPRDESDDFDEYHDMYDDDNAPYQEGVSPDYNNIYSPGDFGRRSAERQQEQQNNRTRDEHHKQHPHHHYDQHRHQKHQHQHHQHHHSHHSHHQHHQHNHDKSIKNNNDNALLSRNNALSPKAATENYEKRLVNSGILAAFESAMMDAASKKVGSGDLLVFLAKQIEQFGRQWNAGYIDKRRFRKGFRTAKELSLMQRQQEIEDAEMERSGEERSSFAPMRPEGRKRPGSRPMNGRIKSANDPNHDAATKLQALHRGRTARVEHDKRQQSAAKLQALHRGRAARSESNSRHQSAAKLQALHRGRAARYESNSRHQSAAKLQALHRGRAARYESNSRHQSAAKLQALHRGRAARYESNSRHQSAAKLQALHRGRAARYESNSRHQSAAKLQALHRGRISRLTSVQQQKSANHLQRHYRGYVARKELKEKKVVATIRQPVVSERDMHVGSPVTTIFGTGFMVSVPREQDDMIQVQMLSWELANGTSPTMYATRDQLRSSRRVQTTMGLGWIIKVRPNGFHEIELDWNGVLICSENALTHINDNSKRRNSINTTLDVLKEEKEIEVLEVLEVLEEVEEVEEVAMFVPVEGETVPAVKEEEESKNN